MKPAPLPQWNGASSVSPYSPTPQNGAQGPVMPAPKLVPAPYLPLAAPVATVVPLKAPVQQYYTPAMPIGPTPYAPVAAPVPLYGSTWPAPAPQPPGYGAQVPAPAPVASTSPFVDIETFMANCPDDAGTWRWDGLLPQNGIAMVAGAPFSGKSVLMAAFAASTSLGLPLAGRSVEAGRVLYAKLEHRDADFKAIFLKAKKAVGGASLGGNLLITTKLNLDDLDAVAAFDLEASRCGIDVIIIDSLRRTSRMDENKSEETAEVMARAQRLTGEGKRLVVVLHHVTKSTMSPRGSTDLLASVDSFLLLTRKDNCVTINATHHGGVEAVVTMEMSFDDETLSITEVEKPAPGSQQSSGDTVKAVILHVCGMKEMTKSGLRDAVRRMVQAQHKFSVGNETIDKYVEELAQAGRLKNLGGKSKSGWVTVPVSAPSPAGQPVPGGGPWYTPPLPTH